MNNGRRMMFPSICRNPPEKSSEVIHLPEHDRRQRRRWSQKEKLRIVKEAQTCTRRGELGALLCREGIYSSLLYQWRMQFEAQGEAGLAEKPIGRKPKRKARDFEFEKMRREKAKLER